MLEIICLLVLAIDPVSRWQVSFNAEISLVRGNGESMLLVGSELYVYDPEGEPIENVTLAFTPENAWIAPDDRVLLHDGQSILGALNEGNQLIWQRELSPSMLTPFFAEGLLVYVTESDILLLDPDDGDARFSRRLSRPITALTALDEWLLISDGGADALAWSPSSGLERVRAGVPGDITAAARGPEGYRALVHDGGRLVVSDGDGRGLWSRSHHIDISVGPVWTEAPRRAQLLVGTLGRRVFVYSPNGRQLATTLVPARIRAMIPFAGQRVLIIADLHDKLIWYDAATRRFHREALAAPVRDQAIGGDYVLVVDEGGMIALFDKSVARETRR